MSSSVRAGVIAIAALALAIGLSGCGSDSETEATDTAETSTSENAAEATPSEAAPSTPGQPAAANYTIADYIRENSIVETPVKRGDPGSPAINVPVPPGWADAGAQAPPWAYLAMAPTDPEMVGGGEPPSIIALVSKLTGNVDPAKILEFAPGELNNMPGYEGAQTGSPSKLGGFDAVQLGGTYTKDGVTRAIAQKTVVIPGQDGLFVLQLNADGREDQMPTLMDATTVIDEETTITP
ncbi:LpqN/LpqT family lipoprotein [Mycobacterium sp. B14F4]|uniref:LpqN/LpqT family lipoprotein n=1 Tax=Mycobacterium sp. B14F4 TaxID=3153565 RepID=UPI00325CB202